MPMQRTCVAGLGEAIGMAADRMVLISSANAFTRRGQSPENLQRVTEQCGRLGQKSKGGVPNIWQNL